MLNSIISVYFIKENSQQSDMQRTSRSGRGGFDFVHGIRAGVNVGPNVSIGHLRFVLIPSLLHHHCHYHLLVDRVWCAIRAHEVAKRRTQGGLIIIKIIY